jgi:hypothetical protein
MFTHGWIGGRWDDFEDLRTWGNDHTDKSLSVLPDTVEREYREFGVIVLLDI